MSYGSYGYGSTTYGGAIALAAVLSGNTKQRPKVLLRYGRINEPIRVPIYDLLVDSYSTFAINDSIVAQNNLEVKNDAGFAVNQILLVGSPGQEGSEIVKTSATVAPTGGVITLTTGMRLPHAANTPIYIINFDQVEYSVAQTINGPKVILATSSIMADSKDTTWNDANINTGFYFARWKNSITGLFSTYSDGVPMISYTKYMARSIIQGALGEINKDIGEVITDEYAFQMINLCTEEVLSEQKRWSFMQRFDQNIGTIAQGSWFIDCPPDLPEDETVKYTYNFRIGTSQPLTWIDKEQLDKFLSQVAYSILQNPIYIGDASVVLESTANFKDTGTIDVGSDVLTYTANNKATNTLTLQQVALNPYAQSTAVLQTPEKGDPKYFTTWGGKYYFYPVAGAHQAGKNVNTDYYAAAVTIKTDTDEIVFPDAAAAQYYLEWKFLLKINKGQETPDSQAKQNQFQGRLTRLVQKNSIGRTFRLRPRFNNWSKQMSFGYETESERDRLGNFPNI